VTSFDLPCSFRLRNMTNDTREVGCIMLRRSDAVIQKKIDSVYYRPKTMKPTNTTVTSEVTNSSMLG
jgi:hypothetical protein